MTVNDEKNNSGENSLKDPNRAPERTIPRMPLAQAMANVDKDELQISDAELEAAMSDSYGYDQTDPASDHFENQQRKVDEKIYRGAIKPNVTDTAPKKDLLGRDRVIGLRTAASGIGVNPKDRIGAAKVDLTLIPGSAQIHLALALMDGANKYGAYNWRAEPVLLRTYVAAAQRHLLDFLDGENDARDSGIRHLGHAMACCAIMIDAMHQGMATDDRPIVKQVNLDTSHLLDVANQWIKNNKPEGWGK